jgi:hypothetical protein
MKAAKGFIRRGAFEFIPFPQWLMGKNEDWRRLSNKTNQNIPPEHQDSAF